jgi:hypothetical protein
MQLHFQLTFDDYRAAQRLHARRSIWSRFVRVLTRYVYPVIGFLFLALSFSLVRDRSSNESVSTMIICGIVLLCCPIYLHFQLKRCYKRTRTASEGCHLALEEQSIQVEGEFSKGELSWKAILSFREGAEVFLLYLAPAKFIPIPKRVCSQEQIGELRNLLLSKVQPATV